MTTPHEHTPEGKVDTYNVSADDLKKYAIEIDASLQGAYHLEGKVEHLIWVTQELYKIAYYTAKRLDELQNSKHD